MGKKLVFGIIATGIMLSLTPAMAAKDQGRSASRNVKSVTIEVDNGYQDRDRDNRRANSRDNGNRYDRSDNRRVVRNRIIKRQTFNTRYRANIVLVEQVVNNRRGPQRVCTVDVRGPQAHLVSKRRVNQIARNNCARRAQVRILA